MPLFKGKENVERNIRELMTGNVHRRTSKKFGKKKADKQSIAIALKKAGMSKGMGGVS